MQVYHEIPRLVEDRGIAHGEETPDFFVDIMVIDDTVKHLGMEMIGLQLPEE